MYCGYFALLHASLRLLSSAGSLDLSNFWPKMAKNRGFSKILGRKKFFSKKIFAPSFDTFYCGSFEPSHSYVPLLISSCSPNEQVYPISSTTTVLDSCRFSCRASKWEYPPPASSEIWEYPPSLAKKMRLYLVLSPKTPENHHKNKYFWVLLQF